MSSEIKEETKKCPSCDETISAKVKRCPHCRQDLRSWFRRHPILTFLGVIFLLIAVLSSSNPLDNVSKSNVSKSDNSVSPKPEKKDVFKASVNFTGTQFVINNLDKYDCQNAKMGINGGLFSDGYSLDGYRLEAGKQYTVGAGQFTKSDGSRFNPFTMKPQSFDIYCRGNNELTSVTWYGEFK